MISFSSPVPAKSLGLQDFKTRLNSWCDFDVAADHLGVVLGLWKDQATFGQRKWVFWSANPLGEILHEILLKMVTEGILLENKRDLQFRWNELYIWEDRDA